jgi:hypothetical protein
MALSDALAPDVSLVYVGGTPHPSGADWTVATSSTSSWEIAVQAMLGMRNLAIVVPGYTPGMQWELRYLTEQGMLERSLLIMLPGGLRCGSCGAVGAHAPRDAGVRPRTAAVRSCWRVSPIRERRRRCPSPAVRQHLGAARAAGSDR